MGRKRIIRLVNYKNISCFSLSFPHIHGLQSASMIVRILFVFKDNYDRIIFEQVLV